MVGFLSKKCSSEFIFKHSCWVAASLNVIARVHVTRGNHAMTTWFFTIFYLESADVIARAQTSLRGATRRGTNLPGANFGPL